MRFGPVSRRDGPDWPEPTYHAASSVRPSPAPSTLRRGVERGEVRIDIRPDVVAQMLAGALFARHVAGAPGDDAWVDALFDVIWEGVAPA